jgi:dienelactone hydrolase
MKRILATFAFVVVASSAVAAPPFQEQTVMVKKPGLFGYNIETQVYSPNAPGHYPIVVLNHGHTASPDQRESFRGQAIEFLKRGYVVVVPFRAGHSHSGGMPVKGSCYDVGMVRELADDVVPAIDYAKTLPNVDPTKIVLIGISQGGMTVAGLGAMNIPGVIGIVNFVGGAKQPGCKSGYYPTITAFATLGKTSTVPALFAYGDNDDYGSAEPADSAPRQLMDAYNKSGGHATFYDYGEFGSDSHVMFVRKAGLPLWVPEVGKFFESLGLNWQVQSEIRAPFAWDHKKSREIAAHGNNLESCPRGDSDDDGTSKSGD